MLRFQRFGFCDGSFHAFGPWRQDDLRAKGFQQVSAFDAHRVGHRQDQSVFANGGDERQADSGVAAGRLDDDAARFEQAFFSASSIMANAMRSFTLPAGLKYSSFAMIRAGRSCLPYWFSSSSGVLPIRSVSRLAIFSIVLFLCRLFVGRPGRRNITVAKLLFFIP